MKAPRLKCAYYPAPGGTVCLMHNLASFTSEAEAKRRVLTPHEAEARGIASRGTAAAICAAAERFGADNTCVDSHTRPGFTAKVLGSVALAVLQTSRRPVLVVWPPTD